MIWNITRTRRGLSIASFQIPSGTTDRKILASNKLNEEIFFMIDLEDDLDFTSFFEKKTVILMALTEARICNN